MKVEDTSGILLRAAETLRCITQLVPPIEL